MRSTTWRAPVHLVVDKPGASHVIGCRLTQETRVQNALDEWRQRAICQALPVLSRSFCASSIILCCTSPRSRSPAVRARHTLPATSSNALEPSFLEETASYDAASNVCQARPYPESVCAARLRRAGRRTWRGGSRRGRSVPGALSAALPRCARPGWRCPRSPPPPPLPPPALAPPPPAASRFVAKQPPSPPPPPARRCRAQSPSPQQSRDA